ncbi:GntR family transcriptional regulator [Microbacterium caowuchunii]|uniref:GntR family transcriptional regulator n=1 Tax=Microbacterium caowuchunii TaxID=2614638 RepID=UPI0012476441|nr:GntR family transcriptional regulator [Microbacterium caowuchunii]QEW01262.1 GntR family transcriptional regulator [Microbacterium caowuchunii]
MPPSQAPQDRLATGTPSRYVPYAKIRDAIISGEFAPGQPLNESALATWCGVSRTPIREAISRLEQDALVTWNENGLVVRAMEPEEILDFYEVRAYLEAASARTAADRRTDRDVQMLRAKLAAGDAVDAGATRDMVQYSRGFMDLILRISRNLALVDALSRVKLQLSRTIEANPTVAYPGRWEQTREFQTAVTDLIAQRDVDGAYDVTLKHFFAARDVRLLMLSAEDA